ncbi:MAG: hypothetical protein IT462_04560 [Planctomycetes bacterium]|nr:hypothetical protein [Planctomycetota bacterium]
MIKLRDHATGGLLAYAMFFTVPAVLLPTGLFVALIQNLLKLDLSNQMSVAAVLINGIFFILSFAPLFVLTLLRRSVSQTPFVLISHGDVPIRYGTTHIRAEQITNVAYEFSRPSSLLITYKADGAEKTFPIWPPGCLLGFLKGERVNDIIRRAMKRAKTAPGK